MDFPPLRLDRPAEELALEGTGFVVALLLSVLLVALIRPENRRMIRLPLFCIAVFLVVDALWLLLPEEGFWERPIRVIAVSSILLASARGVFLLLFYSRITVSWADTLPAIFRDIILVFFYMAVAMGTLRVAGVEPGSLLTTSAVITAVLGLSLQDTLGNLFAGLALEAQRPFDVGDWVQFDNDRGPIGQVIEINWRATKILTLDRIEVTVPNGTIAKVAIRNYTKPTGTSRRTLTIYAPLSARPQEVRRALLDALVGAPGVLPTPDPQVLVGEYEESRLSYKVRYFIDDFRQAEITDGLVRERLWYALGRAGVEPPFPRRDVFMTEVNEEATKRALARDVDARLRALKYVSLFDVLPADQHRKLAEQATVRLYTAGEKIIRMGDEGTDLFVIIKGEVSVLVESELAKSMEVARLEAGAFFGEMSLMTGQARTATVRAETECEVLVVDHRPFRAVLEARPELAESISEMLAARKVELEQRNSLETEVARAARTDETSKEILGRIRDFFKL